MLCIDLYLCCFVVNIFCMQIFKRSLAQFFTSYDISQIIFVTENFVYAAFVKSFILVEFVVL